MKDEIRDAIKQISKVANDDPEYAKSWHKSVVDLSQRGGVSNQIANDFAAFFMKGAFEVDTSGYRGGS